MSVVSACTIPERSLLEAYRRDGAYTDCYATEVPGTVSFERYVEAFYTTWLFKLERWILLLASRPSADAEAARLARGEIDRFAAWTVEGRAEGQVLLRDYTGRTRSWLMVDGSEASKTRLYFGSAVVPQPGPDSKRKLGFPFDLLLDFHKAYSVALLHAARARLVRPRPAASSA